MKIELSYNQREFLEKNIKIYSKYPKTDFPRERVTNILSNGYYYDDRSSIFSIPIHV